MKKITETKTMELIVITRAQAQTIYDLLLDLGQWKVLEILKQPRMGKEEAFLETLWDEFEEVLSEE